MVPLSKSFHYNKNLILIHFVFKGEVYLIILYNVLLAGGLVEILVG